MKDFFEEPATDPMAQAAARREAVFNGEPNAGGIPEQPDDTVDLGYDPTAEPIVPDTLLLADDKSSQKRDKSAEDKHLNIKCPECDTVQSAKHKVCSSCGHDLADAKKAKFANMAVETGQVACPRCGVHQPDGDKCTRCGTPLKGGKHLDQGDDPQLAASIYERLALSEGDGGEDKDGLIWKAICKTGTLALSPGPGQIDVEKPLELHDEMFDGLVDSVERKAFPHVTIPLSHDNGILENAGYVRELAVKDAPDGEKLLMAGLEFTDPAVKEKVLNGSIADTSVGVKFNYRNKRTGENFPYALEHVALTNIPWVDGLPAFGTQLSQDAPYDQEQGTSADEHTGVFAHPGDIDEKPAPEPTPTPARRRPRRAPRHLSRPEPARKRQDILPRTPRSGTMPSVTDRKPTRRTAAPKGKSVEQLLAAQQARQERQDLELSQTQQELQLAQAETRRVNKELAEAKVAEKVRDFQSQGIAPAVVSRYEEISLAAVAAKYSDDADTDPNVLVLSVKPSGGDADAEPVETAMGATEAVEYLMAAVPSFGTGDLQDVVARATELNASAKPSEKSAAEKADEIEKKTHPERFNDDGSRKEEVAA